MTRECAAYQEERTIFYNLTHEDFCETSDDLSNGLRDLLSSCLLYYL